MSNLKPIPDVKGIPFIGNTLEMAKCPASFFLRAYREYGPVYRVNVFGRKTIVIAGTEASIFMTTPLGRKNLRSKDFWEDFREFHGASRILTGTDGKEHQELRSVMREGFSREAVKGRYHELAGMVDSAIERDWKVGTKVPVVEACQYMVVQQIGELMTGVAPLEFVKDIRVNILFLLNTLVTRQRPKCFLKFPSFKKANKRFNMLGENLIAEFKEHAKNGTLPKNLLGDIMRTHNENPSLIPEQDLLLTLTGPYLAGLDTVANTLASAIYAIIKHPETLKAVQKEADELMAKETITEADVLGLTQTNNAIKEAMRLWPIAVAQMRASTCDFEFEGCLIPANELLYVGTSVPHFMEEYFENPKKYDPSRFEKDRAEHMKPGVFSPFGRGPHTCLGQNLAGVLMGMTIARLFHRTNLSLESPDYVMKTKTAPTPGPAMNFIVNVDSERKEKNTFIAETKGEIQ